MQPAREANVWRRLVLAGIVAVLAACGGEATSPASEHEVTWPDSDGPGDLSAPDGWRGPDGRGRHDTDGPGNLPKIEAASAVPVSGAGTLVSSHYRLRLVVSPQGPAGAGTSKGYRLRLGPKLGAGGGK